VQRMCGRQEPWPQAMRGGPLVIQRHRRMLAAYLAATHRAPTHPHAVLRHLEAGHPSSVTGTSTGGSVIASGSGASRNWKRPDPGLRPSRFGAATRVPLETGAACRMVPHLNRSTSACSASTRAVNSVRWRCYAASCRCCTATKASRASRLKPVRGSRAFMARNIVR
jgi:hypothetical protein